MYKLHGTKMTGTCAVHAALEELGVAYELIEVTLEAGQHLRDDYRKIIRASRCRPWNRRAAVSSPRVRPS